MTIEQISFSNFGQFDLLYGSKLRDYYTNHKMTKEALDIITDETTVTLCRDTNTETMFLRTDDFYTFMLDEKRDKLVIYVICPECDNESSQYEYKPRQGCKSCEEIDRTFNKPVDEKTNTTLTPG